MAHLASGGIPGASMARTVLDDRFGQQDRPSCRCSLLTRLAKSVRSTSRSRAVLWDASLSLGVDAEAEDAAWLGDLARLRKAVGGIGVDAPGVDRERFAFGADLKRHIIECVGRIEVNRLAQTVGVLIAFAIDLLEAGDRGRQSDRLDARLAL